MASEPPGTPSGRYRRNEEGTEPGSVVPHHKLRPGRASPDRAFLRRVHPTEPQDHRNGSWVWSGPPTSGSGVPPETYVRTSDRTAPKSRRVVRRQSRFHGQSRARLRGIGQTKRRRATAERVEKPREFSLFKRS